MSVYTRTGDGGQTRLANGVKVSKADFRVQIYGEVDELNSHIGLGIAYLGDELNDLKESLLSEQSLLFEIGSELAGFKAENIECVIFLEDIERLESEIDRMDASIKKMQAFILPGGSPAAAALHVARCVCRRVERQLVQGEQKEPGSIHSHLIKFINRLSDYLFIAARYANARSGGGDIKWASRARKQSRGQ